MLSKYYSLDECYDRNVVMDYLEELQNEEMIVFEVVDSEVIKIKDIGLSEKQTKELILFFHDNDVIDYDTDRSDDSDNENENPKKWQKLSHSKSNDNDNNDNENPIINSAHPSRHVQIRRERNRIHARHARERKKAHMDTLEQRIQMLIDQVIQLSFIITNII